jgi:hypothetical protein
METALKESPPFTPPSRLMLWQWAARRSLLAAILPHACSIGEPHHYYKGIQREEKIPDSFSFLFFFFFFLVVLGFELSALRLLGKCSTT